MLKVLFKIKKPFITSLGGELTKQQVPEDGVQLTRIRLEGDVTLNM